MKVERIENVDRIVSDKHSLSDLWKPQPRAYGVLDSAVLICKYVSL